MSKIKMAMIEAYEKGYRLTRNGLIVNPRGSEQKLCRKQDGYLYFGYHANSINYKCNIKAARFAALCIYGDELFTKGNVVHITGNDDGRYKNVALLDSYTARSIRDDNLQRLDNYEVDLERVDEAKTLLKKELSKGMESVLIAYLRGYRILDDGSYVNPAGFILPITNYEHEERYAYPLSNFRYGGSYRSFKIHRLAAFCFYGSVMLEEGIEVRHLNADVNDVSRKNIALGTHQENLMDIHPDVRKKANKKASNKSIHKIRHFGKEKIFEVLEMLRETKLTNREISEFTGVPQHTVLRIKKERIYLDVIQEFEEVTNGAG